jgi:hypothetical protein
MYVVALSLTDGQGQVQLNLQPDCLLSMFHNYKPQLQVAFFLFDKILLLPTAA